MTIVIGVMLNTKTKEMIIIPQARHEIGYSTYLGTIFYKISFPYDIDELGDLLFKACDDSRNSPMVTDGTKRAYSKEFSNIINYSKYKKHLSISFEETEGYTITLFRNHKRAYVSFEGDHKFNIEPRVEKLYLAKKIIESFEFCK
jgi:hypothetical protein